MNNVAWGVLYTVHLGRGQYDGKNPCRVVDTHSKRYSKFDIDQKSKF